MSPQFMEMAEVARSFCTLVEQLDASDSAWLHKVSLLLPRLHAAVASLGFSDTDGEHSLTPDLDARFELFSRLRKILGDRDPYWMEYDVAHDGQNMSGSLADDLTDIYCELKHGLMLMDGQPEASNKALDGWRSGYKIHWGQHLVDAERHLYVLNARGKLDWHSPDGAG